MHPFLRSPKEVGSPIEVGDKQIFRLLLYILAVSRTQLATGWSTVCGHYCMSREYTPPVYCGFLYKNIYNIYILHVKYIYNIYIYIYRFAATTINSEYTPHVYCLWPQVSPFNIIIYIIYIYVI